MSVREGRGRGRERDGQADSPLSLETNVGREHDLSQNQESDA